MENWCYEKKTLSTIARHYETGAPLPEVSLRVPTCARVRACACVRARARGCVCVVRASVHAVA